MDQIDCTNSRAPPKFSAVIMDFGMKKNLKKYFRKVCKMTKLKIEINKITRSPKVLIRNEIKY